MNDGNTGVIDISHGWPCHSILQVCCRHPRPIPTTTPQVTTVPAVTSTAIPGFNPRCGTLNPNGINARILGFKVKTARQLFEICGKFKVLNIFGKGLRDSVWGVPLDGGHFGEEMGAGEGSILLSMRRFPCVALRGCHCGPLCLWVRKKTAFLRTF